MQWREVFLADLTPPDQRKGNGNRQTEGPTVTFAKEALATPDVPNNRIQLSLRTGSTHEFGKQQASDYSTAFPAMEQTLEAQKREARQVKAYTEVDTLPLYRLAYDKTGPTPNVEARLEFHQRLALPFACILFAMVGLPLGISQRRAGKSFAFVVTVLLAVTLPVVRLICQPCHGQVTTPSFNRPCESGAFKCGQRSGHAKTCAPRR